MLRRLLSSCRSCVRKIEEGTQGRDIRGRPPLGDEDGRDEHRGGGGLGALEGLKLVGEGSRARVFCFRGGGRALCLKMLIVHDAEGVQDMQREAQVLTALRELPRQPRLLSLHADRLVMTFHSPFTLQRLAEQPASLITMLEALLQLAQTLANVHAAGFTHNDVKPDNVSVALAADWPVTVTLLDLGLATPAGHTPREFLSMRTDEKAERARSQALRQQRHPWYAPELYHGGPYSPFSDAFFFAFTAHSVLGLLPRPPAALLTALLESMSSAESLLSTNIVQLALVELTGQDVVRSLPLATPAGQLQ